MLRQTQAKWLAVSTVLSLVAVAAAMAQLRNPPAAPAPAQTPASDAVGARAFKRLGCAQCHSFRGIGEASMPLDGIGQRMDRAAIRDNASASGAAQSKFPVSLARRKARASADADFERLIDYLAQDSKPAAPPR